MTLAIMQPYFLPYLGYWQLLNAADKFVFLDDVAFINRGWVNRNQMLLNGQAHLFTVPLRGASQNALIRDIALADDPKWRGKLLKTVEQAYRKAPHFATVMPIMEKIVNFAPDTIADYIVHSFAELTPYLGITTPVVATSAVYGNQHLRAQDRIVDICRQEGATRYLNPPGGQVLYQADAFAEWGCQLQFLKPRLNPYLQFGNAFVPGLSMLDILMFNTPADVRTMLNDFDVI